MDARKSHFMGLVWGSMLIVLFTAAASIIIVVWSPMLPEAIAVDMNRADLITVNDFAPYIALHQTESWLYTAVLREPVAIAYCLR